MELYMKTHYEPAYKSKQVGFENKDLRSLESILEQTIDYKSPFPEFVVKTTSDGFNIIDESVHAFGTKARFANYYMSKLENDHLVYVAPRVGYAGLSLAYLTREHGKKLTLVMPASKQVSHHQALAIQYGAEPLFVRIAAMPNANAYAKRYAEAVGAAFAPFGLDHPDVYAGAVTELQRLRPQLDGKRIWSVISTGVLSRSLQIALPETEIVNVAVARNIQHGELGRAHFTSYHKKFTDKSDVIPSEFNSVDTYDAKGWHYLKEYGKKGDYFYNVAGEPPAADQSIYDIDSQRDWRDLSDFKGLI